MAISKFEYTDRGFSETLLLVPGWAMDRKIFASLDLDFNYLSPTALCPTDFNEALLSTLSTAGLRKISILGHSMGGYLAADFAVKYPDRVKAMTLIGMRRRYDAGGINKIKGYVGTNKKGYLYKFYHECFSPEENKCLSLFKNGPMKSYLKDMTEEALVGGLDYLSRASLDGKTLKNVKVRLIHGEGDKIAPVEEALALKKEADSVDLTIMKGAGHIPFLRDDFKTVFYRKARCNFSKYADSYDEHTAVQTRAANTLMSILPDEDIKNILEIGCGTGNYTRLLADRFKESRVRAIDISGPMIDRARQKMGCGNVCFETSDAEEADMGTGYDLITSNAAFHWLSDIDGVLKKSASGLKAGGVIAFSSFAPETFRELKSALSAAFGKDVTIASGAFPDKDKLTTVLKKYFREVRVNEEFFRERYPSLSALLKSIKYSGTTGFGIRARAVWSPGLVKKIEAIYMERFGSIEATYQIFFCRARL